jgi:uroporphyrinogen-III decarboxylase
MGVDTALMNLALEPEAMKDLIDYITEWELGYAKLLCKHFKPDCIFHHDDWGSQPPRSCHLICLMSFLLNRIKDIWLLQGKWR